MKKFLFTLAAMLMVGSAFAQDAENYFTIDDFEVAQDQLGTNNVRVDVKGHFANYVSAWQVNFTYPEGITCRGFVKGSDLTLTYLDELGDEQTLTPALNKNADLTRCIVAQTEAAYDADGNYLGAAQWAPGEYAQMWQMVLVVAEDFAGGDMILYSECSSSGWMDNSNIAPKNTWRETTTHITVEGGEEPPKDLTGTVQFGEITEDGLLPISYDGEEDVTITVTVNGEEATLTDGMVQLAEGENAVVVTVTCDGYNDLVVTQDFTYTAPEVPVVTPTPEIVVTEGEEAYVITVVGEGELHMYVNNDEVEFPYTIARGEEDVTYVITATAQGENMQISETATKTVVVPALAGGEEPDPHAQGYWIVVYTQDGQEVWNEFMYSNGQYTMILPLDYETYGTFDWANGAPRPDVEYYIVIDGVRYGAAEGDMTETFLGDAMMNPLAENENLYYLAEGLGIIYNMGIFYDEENQTYYVYAAKAGTVGIDELVDGKQIANVRYFNLAGQEMQEANGMIIVVTTYTDGTTSAAKVMK